MGGTSASVFPGAGCGRKRNRPVAFTSSALTWSLFPSCPLISAFSNGVTDPRFSAAPAVAASGLPRLGLVLIAARSLVPLELENMPRNTKIMTMTAMARTNRPLLRSTFFAVRACLSGRTALRPSLARTYASRSEAKRVLFSSGSAASSCSAGPLLIRRVTSASATSGRPSVLFDSGVMLFGSFLAKTADSETDRRQGRPVDRAGIGHLKQQGFVGLLEARPLENQDAISAFSGADPPLAHAEILHGQLLGVGPDGVAHDHPLLHLAPQLHLRRHQLDRVFLHVHHGKQHHNFLPLIDHLADARLQNLFSRRGGPRLLAVESGKRSPPLPLQQGVEASCCVGILRSRSTAGRRASVRRSIRPARTEENAIHGSATGDGRVGRRFRCLVRRRQYYGLSDRDRRRAGLDDKPAGRAVPHHEVNTRLRPCRFASADQQQTGLISAGSRNEEIRLRRLCRNRLDENDLRLPFGVFGRE